MRRCWPRLEAMAMSGEDRLREQVEALEKMLARDLERQLKEKADAPEKEPGKKANEARKSRHV